MLVSIIITYMIKANYCEIVVEFYMRRIFFFFILDQIVLIDTYDQYHDT